MAILLSALYVRTVLSVGEEIAWRRPPLLSQGAGLKAQIANAADNTVALSAPLFKDKLMLAIVRL
ncbi:hypothetical protein BW716_18520 [[Flexibacter] sp. ATCC 35208]|nr:hypothetical protein BW716_18520 [[Flexibacter] sp. ATCC 35208]